MEEIRAWIELINELGGMGLAGLCIILAYLYLKDRKNERNNR